MALYIIKPKHTPQPEMLLLAADLRAANMWESIKEGKEEYSEQDFENQYKIINHLREIVKRR